MSFEDLRAEYTTERIGRLIYAEVERVVRTLTRRYDPRQYGFTEDWADSREDVVQGIVAEMLLGEGQLDYIFAQATSIEDFRRLLFYQSKRYLARRRLKTVIANLVKRAKAILSDAPFEPIGREGVQFQLQALVKERRSPTEAELRLVARIVAPIPRVIFKVHERAPIVYTQENLAALLKLVAGELPCTFSLRDLDEIFGLLLTDWVPGFLEGDDEEQAAPGDLSPEEEAEVREAYEAVMAEIEEAEQPIFRAAIARRPDRELAAELGVSRPTVIARRQRLLERLQPILVGLDDHLQSEVIGRVGVSLALPDGEDRNG